MLYDREVEPMEWAITTPNVHRIQLITIFDPINSLVLTISGYQPPF